MQSECKADEQSEGDGNRERHGKSLQRIGKMKPKNIGLHQRAEKAHRLPRRAQGYVANDEIGQLPKQEQADDQDDCIAQRREFRFLHHFCPLLASSTLSQYESRLLAATASSRIIRISGYMVALSKFV